MRDAEKKEPQCRFIPDEIARHAEFTVTSVNFLQFEPQNERAKPGSNYH